MLAAPLVGMVGWDEQLPRVVGLFDAVRNAAMRAQDVNVPGSVRTSLEAAAAVLRLALECYNEHASLAGVIHRAETALAAWDEWTAGQSVSAEASTSAPPFPSRE